MSGPGHRPEPGAVCPCGCTEPGMIGFIGGSPASGQLDQLETAALAHLSIDAGNVGSGHLSGQYWVHATGPLESPSPGTRAAPRERMDSPPTQTAGSSLPGRPMVADE